VRQGLLFVAIVLFAARAMAQTSIVSGTVVDESGAAVPGATVTLSAPSVREVTTTGPTGDYRFANIAPGTYQISVLVVGFAPANRDNVTVGSDGTTVPPITLALGNFEEAVIVTASRIEAPLVNAPATMTVLPAAVIAASSAQNYGDLLRAVPGLNVIQMSARDINLTSRQATSTIATSQLALVDGRSIYLDFFGLILWDFVPTNMNEIKQIEVVRGPASAVWGANALTGVVNIVTKPPRETGDLVSVILNAGWFDRDVGSTVGRSAGAMYGGNVSTSQVVNDRWSYRLSAGYFNSDPYPRPTGRIPVVVDPRDPTGQSTVGGAFYPVDGPGSFGTSFVNKGTSQPKFDARVDQELSNGRVTYSGGVAGTEGIIYSGIGPLDIQPGSVMGYGKVGYSRGALRIAAFANIVDAEAPNLLVPDARTGMPLRLDFKTQTYDLEASHATGFGRHALSYGGNYRRNNFEITGAPGAKDRNEIGGYAQDEIFFNRWRFTVGGRVDKFGNIDDPVFSPRLAAIFKPTSNQSVRLSFNRAFRSPSTVNNYLDVALITPVDLRALGIPPPFPLTVLAVGSELPIGSMPQEPLKQESLTAYEVAFTSTLKGRTTLGAAFYVNDVHDGINFVTLPSNLDPYTAANPPPGWPLPPVVLTALAQAGVYLPRTLFTYLNLGPTRQKGLELSLDHRFLPALSAFANYSWQDDPEILEDPNPFPVNELSLPATNRFNAGGTYNGGRFLGSLSVNYSDGAFWSDVLTSAYHGFTDAYTLVNGSFGVRWASGKVTTTIKVNNLLNETVQQHVFGDLMRRSVMGEVRLDFSRSR
jgi:outer membrane receptor for ferrienterochelin and colicins